MIRPLFVALRLWFLLIAFVMAFVVAWVFPLLLPLVQITFGVFLLLVGIDGWLLFRPTPAKQTTFFARRDVPDRLSNGDENPLTIYLENRYPFRMWK